MNIFCGTLAIELDNSLSLVNYWHSCFPQKLTCCAEEVGCCLRGGPRCARGHSGTSGWAKSAWRRGCPSKCPYSRLESARPSRGPASPILQSLLQLGRHDETVWTNANAVPFQQRFLNSWKKKRKRWCCQTAAHLQEIVSLVSNWSHSVKMNSQGELTGFYGNRLLITSSTV